VPVVVITGDEDQVADRAVHAARLAEAVDDGRLVVLNDVGHVPHHVSPNVIAFEINRLVERMWSRAQGA
jgi:pimeloyl-ACP methyl ester carboxylesterase